MTARGSGLVKSWSYSRAADYRKCPARFRFKHIAKLPEPSSPALERGGAVDEAVTRYLDGTSRTLPAESKFGLRYGKLRDELAVLRKAKARTQLELAVTRDWEPCDWRDWDRAWLRAKLDAALLIDSEPRVLRIIDNKTGKVRPEEHAEQVEIYAAVAAAFYPEAEEIRGQLFYLDQGFASDPAVFTDLRRTVPRLRMKWEKITAPMFRDTRFRATPGGHCVWCPYSGKRGGPCDKG